MSKGRVLTKKKWGHCARYWRKYKYGILLSPMVNQTYFMTSVYSV